MPLQKPGHSKQDYQTPPEFLKALKNRLSIEDFSIDLAASEENKVTSRFYDEEADALRQCWDFTGWGFCNPPYANLADWTYKAATESSYYGCNIAMLVPASVGSNWWRDYVDGIAHVLFLNGRITFVGAINVYPKDCAVLFYTPIVCGGYEIWAWHQGC